MTGVQPFPYAPLGNNSKCMCAHAVVVEAIFVSWLSKNRCKQSRVPPICLDLLAIVDHMRSNCIVVLKTWYIAFEVDQNIGELCEWHFPDQSCNGTKQMGGRGQRLGHRPSRSCTKPCFPQPLVDNRIQREATLLEQVCRAREILARWRHIRHRPRTWWLCTSRR